jgi:hypothetical protein
MYFSFYKHYFHYNEEPTFVQGPNICFICNKLCDRKKKGCSTTPTPLFFQSTTSSPQPKPSTLSADSQSSTSKVEDKTPIKEVK